MLAIQKALPAHSAVDILSRSIELRRTARLAFEVVVAEFLPPLAKAPTEPRKEKSVPTTNGANAVAAVKIKPRPKRKIAALSLPLPSTPLSYGGGRGGLPPRLFSPRAHTVVLSGTGGPHIAFGEINKMLARQPDARQHGV